MKDPMALEQLLGYSFHNKDLLLQACTHRSYINEHRQKNSGHNERLEFLGDAIIEIIVTEFLYHAYPKVEEGMLTKLRSALVSTAALREIGEALGLYEYLLLSRGQQKENSRARSHIVAAAYEALIAALYLDRGKDAATTFVTKTLLVRCDQIIAERRYEDAKSLLQERAQERVRLTPVYRVMEECYPDHDKRFIIGVFFGAALIATGEGESKKAAEENAAKEALSILDWKQS